MLVNFLNKKQKQNIKINLSDADGRTPLHYAAFSVNEKSTELLKNIIKESSDNEGRLPYFYTLINNEISQYKRILYLKYYNSNIQQINFELKTKNNQSLLSISLLNGTKHITNYLLEHINESKIEDLITLQTFQQVAIKSPDSFNFLRKQFGSYMYTELNQEKQNLLHVLSYHQKKDLFLSVLNELEGKDVLSIPDIHNVFFVTIHFVICFVY